MVCLDDSFCNALQSLGEMGCEQLPEDMYDVLLNQVEPKLTADGRIAMTPSDAHRFERLCAMFGVPLKLTESSIDLVSRAYHVFGVVLSFYVAERIRSPDLFRAYYGKRWAPDWVEYINAVATQDHGKAADLDKILEALSPECIFPSDIVFLLEWK
jgi:hypothetical protein